MDPISRAGETLAALLYLRRDVSASQYRLGISMSDHYVFEEKSGNGRIPDGINRLALISGIGQTWEEYSGLDWNLTPNEILEISSQEKTHKAPELHSLISLKTGNAHNAGIYTSDTGELILDKENKQLTVITGKTEAIATQASSASLKSLSIENNTTPALISISSLDDNPVSDSNRMLLILSTDARNSGMKFKDEEQKILENIGHLPVRLKTINIDLKLKHNKAPSLKLYALHLNGSRAEEIKIETPNDKEAHFNINLEALKKGPTTFFELVAG